MDALHRDPNAEVTRYTGDGGIDVLSEGHAVQVKNYTGSVPVQDIRALFGAATADGLRAILFTSGTITRDGMAFAASAGVALIRYNAYDGELTGLNTAGERIVAFGLTAGP